MGGFDYDVAVIGGGSAGFASACATTAGDLKTAVIEGGDKVGGLCILRGCMPTKALLHAADVLHQARRSGVWGIEPGEVGFDFRKIMERRAAMVEEFASYRRGQLKDGRFEFIRANARFRDAHTLDLDSGQSLTAGHFVIATGSRVADLPLPQLEAVGCISSDEALKLEQLPESIIILGGGAVAVEFAQFFLRFDVEVTLVQRSSRILKDFDEDAALALEAAFREEGMKVFTGCRLLDARIDGDYKLVTFEHQGKTVEVRGAEIFHGLGRSPNTGGLDLTNAGLEADAGRILCNAGMQSSVPHVFAAGDCAGPHEIVHLAIQQGEISAHNILHPDQPREMDYRLLTTIVFTDPQVASVGLTEKEALQRGIHPLQASYPFNDHGKSMIMESLHGFVKLFCNPQTGEILGGGCVGPMGGELIHEIVAAMAKNMTVAELAAMPHYHPTLAEIWTYPAEELAEKVRI